MTAAGITRRRKHKLDDFRLLPAARLDALVRPALTTANLGCIAHLLYGIYPLHASQQRKCRFGFVK